MQLSIIVGLYNQLPLTQAMFSSLLSTLPQGLKAEIIFVDDASTDETPLWLDSLALRPDVIAKAHSIQILKNPINLGFAKSNNRAAAAAKGDVLALLNNDLVLQPNWCEPMLSFVLQATKPCIVGNLQYRPDTETLDHAGIEVRLDEQTDRPVIAHMHNIVQTDPYEVFAVTGACCVLPKQTFQDFGGFDETYLNGGEDVDLCLKIKQASGKCWVEPTSKVWHHVSQSRGLIEERDEKNSWRLFKKWHSAIARAFELACAKQVITQSSKEDPLIKRMATEFLEGKRLLAPIAVKAKAKNYVEAELARFEKKYRMDHA
jgi:GT2 family glycosyltransferase